jgi:hypothetical protein
MSKQAAEHEGQMPCAYRLEGDACVQAGLWRQERCCPAGQGAGYVGIPSQPGARRLQLQHRLHQRL